MIKFFSILALCLSVVACQKPGKKKGDASIYENGIQQANAVYAEILQEGIDLDSEESFIRIDRKVKPALKLPAPARKQENEIRIQNKLEKYVIGAEKLMALADTKVVVFPEKEKLRRRLVVASYFLAEIYMDIEWSSQNKFAISRSVDWYEFEGRFSRIGVGSRKLESYGFPTGGTEVKSYPKFSARTKPQFEEADRIYSQGMTDWIRIKDLLERNDNFGNEGFKVFASSAMAIGGYYYNLRQVVRVSMNPKK